MKMKPEHIMELVKLAQQGNESAFEVLMAHCRPQLVAYVRARLPKSKRSCAEDIVQETIYRVWRSLSQLQNPRAFKSWLFKTARRQAINYLKLKSVRPILPTDPAALHGLVVRIRNRGRWKDRALLKHIWEEAENAMTEKQLRVFELHYKEGLTHEQIAEKEQMPLGTVKWLIRKGVQTLQETLNAKK